MNIILITTTDNRYTVREALRRSKESRVLFVLRWDITKDWDSPLDYELLMREACQQELEAAWVIEDPARRPYAREAGFPVFATEEAAEAYLEQHETFPPLSPPQRPKRPQRPLWAEEPKPREIPLPRPQPIWLLIIKAVVLLTVLGIVGLVAYLTIPSAHITLIPEGRTFSSIVPISVDPELEEVDLQRNVIPSRRIGDEFEGYAEVGTTGSSYAFSGRATGWVLFTNLLGQDYEVPEGTIVRTAFSSFPMRFATTAKVVIPAFGHAEAPIEALEEGPRGNIDAYQISLVEGVAGFAVRVTNPGPISGAESEIVATVSEADRERVWDLAAQQVLAEAYNGLQDSTYLEPGEFLPQHSLIIQAAPKAAYTHLAGEQSNVLGLALRLLVTGEAVNASDARAVAYRHLVKQLPENFVLTDARFQYGEAAQEDVGPGRFTFYVTAHGYTSAEIYTEQAWTLIQGKPVAEAAEILSTTLPLAQPPEITVMPEWFPFIPRLPIRAQIDVTPGKW